MGKKTCLLLLLGVSLGQIDVTVTTPQSVYLFGETIPIEVTATNPSADTVTLNFPSTCQAEYIIGSYYSGNHHGCYQVLTQVTLPPNSSFTWNLQNTPSDTLLPVGTYNLVGEVIGVGFSDTIQITISNITTPVDTTQRLSYYPLHIGDRWQYEIWLYNEDGSSFDGYRRIIVTGDTLLPNGKHYLRLERMGQSCTEFFRIDTTDLKVFQYCPGVGCPDSELVYFDLAPPSDSTTYTTCADYTVVYQYQPEIHWLLPDTIYSMTYQWFSGWAYRYKLLPGIGITEWYIGDLNYESGQLTAAEIDGQQYGVFISEDELYFPLELGQSWTYQSGDSLWTETITDTATLDGHLYFEFDHFRDNWSFRQFRWEDNSVRVRIEFDSGAIEDTLYDFNASVGDSWYIVLDPDSPTSATMSLLSKTDTVYTTLGTFTNCYAFDHFIGMDYEYIEWFAPEIGLVQRDVITFAGLRRWTLADTTKIWIMARELNLPRKFTLSQNYPNPFNASTTFKINIPRKILLRFTIYDLLGREIAVLVDGIMRPGVKEIKWDASNMPSGVYFYRLETGGRFVVKKMVLLK
jgi:hypothetical protein